MKELDSTALFDLLFNQKPSKEFRKYETVVRRITRIKTLIEDDNLLNKIITFANGNFCKRNHEPLTLEDAKNPNRQELLYYRVDKNTDSGYSERWSTSRWEGDECEPYFAGYKKYSFNEIIDEYISVYPDNVNWKIEEKIEEER